MPSEFRDSRFSRRSLFDEYGVDPRNGLAEAKVFTTHNAPVPTSPPGVFTRPAADAREDAIWSAKRDPVTGYGIAVFDVDPGLVAWDMTTIRVTYLHALLADPTNLNTGAMGSPNPNYSVFDTFTLTRPRGDRPRRTRRPSHSQLGV